MVEVKQLTVGELAARSGVAVSALHFFERQGLLTSTRTSGNQRRYRRDALRRVALIRVAQRAGIPLKEVAAALAALPEGRPPGQDDWEELGRRWRDRLEERIRTLEALRDQLGGCIGCGCLSMSRCALFNPGDALAAEGPGPRHLLRRAGTATGTEGVARADDEE